jgi:RNase H-fold protein (predicted Holliday junction resolvase)
MIDVGALRMGVAVFELARRRIQVIGSTAWPMADGRIFDSSVQHDDIHGWAAELTYSYTAFGEYYSGIYHRGFRRKKRAEAFLERLPCETPVPVRYKAERPEISTLLLSDMSILLIGL